MLINYNLNITIYHTTVPPDQPHSLIVESSEATSLSINWKSPTLASVYILYYILNVIDVNNTVCEITHDIINTTNNETFYNVTGLLPGTIYELTVVAVFENGSENTSTTFMSQTSGFVQSSTGLTGI